MMFCKLGKKHLSFTDNPPKIFELRYTAYIIFGKGINSRESRWLVGFKSTEWKARKARANPTRRHRIFIGYQYRY
jgi:hypothetical protein